MCSWSKTSDDQADMFSSDRSIFDRAFSDAHVGIILAMRNDTSFDHFIDGIFH